MNSKNKIITIVALIIAVIGLSIGFAAFASTLNISTSAHVNPTNTFSVKFASSASTSDQGLSYSVTPTVAVATSEIGGAEAGSPTIINGNGESSIGNLSAAFTAPGQSVTYTFYVVNDGTFDAYLTNLVFNNASNQNSFKKCEAASGSNGATQSIVDDICITNNNIRLTMSIGNETNITSTTTLNNHILHKGEYETVTVTISFTGEQYADGAFTVSFGDIDLHYRTIDEPVVIPTSDNATSNSAVDVSGTYNKYLAPSSNPTTSFVLNNDGTGKVVMNMGGEDMEVDLTYSHNSSTNIITIDVMGGTQYINYTSIGNNKVVYSIDTGNQFVFSTSGGTGLTPLDGFVYEYSESNVPESGSTITFSNGSYINSYNSEIGTYAVIDDNLFKLKSDGGLSSVSISQDYSSFPNYVKQNN